MLRGQIIVGSDESQCAVLNPAKKSFVFCPYRSSSANP
jgi:hypothetical protein